MLKKETITSKLTTKTNQNKEIDFFFFFFCLYVHEKPSPTKYTIFLISIVSRKKKSSFSALMKLQD